MSTGYTLKTFSHFLSLKQLSTGPLRRHSAHINTTSNIVNQRRTMRTALSYPQPAVIPSKNHTATVIMLHGLGDTAAGWLPVGQQLQHQLPHVKWIFPTAPTAKMLKADTVQRPITCNMGMPMPGWYDIIDMEGIYSKEDERGLKESARYVKELVGKEIETGIPSNRIVVGGFSQGGAIAMMMLREVTNLGGVIGLSSYLPLRNSPDGTVKEDLKGLPVFLGHGVHDPLVKMEYGKMTYDAIKSQGIAAEWHTYPMDHSACPEEIRDVAMFLRKVLP